MRIQQYIASIIFLMTVSGCTKDLVLGPEAVKPLIVIEGRISNLQGPYYVRITKSTGLIPNPDPYCPCRDSAEPVTNALVIITDDAGIKDTLLPSPPTIDRYVYFFRDSVTYSESSIDSVFTTVDDRATTLERGYYQTTKLKGQPGHTYYLEVQIGDSVFRSSAYMPSQVPALEHVEWRDTLLSPYPSSRPMPVVWFKDLPEENYYGVNWTGSIHAYRYDHFLAPGKSSGVTFNVYPYYVFDDKLLTGNLNLVAVRYLPMNPENPVLESPRFEFSTPAPLPTRLYAFTKETYNYLNTAYKQLEYHGNIYKPAPTSPGGNISGGALGLFYATAISDKLCYH